MIPSSIARSLVPRQRHLWQTIGQSSSGVRFFSEEDSSRLHSTDIAFKPAESGWGGGNKYTNNFDAIFGSGGGGGGSKQSTEESKTVTGTGTKTGNKKEEHAKSKDKEEGGGES